MLFLNTKNAFFSNTINYIAIKYEECSILIAKKVLFLNYKKCSAFKYGKRSVLRYEKRPIFKYEICIAFKYRKCATCNYDKYRSSKYEKWFFILKQKIANFKYEICAYFKYQCYFYNKRHAIDGDESFKKTNLLLFPVLSLRIHFLVFFILLNIRRRRWPSGSYSLQYFSSSCQYFQDFSWIFQFSCFNFVRCYWSTVTVGLTFSNRFL